MGAHSHDHLEFFWWVAEGSLVEARSGFSSNHRSLHLGWRQVWGNDSQGQGAQHVAPHGDIPGCTHRTHPDSFLNPSPACLPSCFWAVKPCFPYHLAVAD